MYVQREDVDNAVAEFDAWLTETATDADPERRNAKLAEWENAPWARFCHPREEHLLPLHVAAGAGGADIGHHAFGDKIVGKAISGYRFG
jgi:aromatic ring-opening dioxygenase catalytic subunit (LigB family)